MLYSLLVQNQPAVIAALAVPQVIPHCDQWVCHRLQSLTDTFVRWRLPILSFLGQPPCGECQGEVRSRNALEGVVGAALLEEARNQVGVPPDRAERLHHRLRQDQPTPLQRPPQPHQGPCQQAGHFRRQDQAGRLVEPLLTSLYRGADQRAVNELPPALNDNQPVDNRFGGFLELRRLVGAPEDGGVHT